MVCAVDHVCNSSFNCEPGRQNRTGSHEDSCMKIDRRLPKIIGDRNHCFLPAVCLLMIARRNAASGHSAPASRTSRLATAGAGRIVRFRARHEFRPANSCNGLKRSHSPCKGGSAVPLVLHRNNDLVEVGVMRKQKPLTGVRIKCPQPLPQITLGDCIVRILEHSGFKFGIHQFVARLHCKEL